jgi:hypothetical protein
MSVFFDNLLASRFVVLWRTGTFSYQDADSLCRLALTSRPISNRGAARHPVTLGIRENNPLATSYSFPVNRKKGIVR